MVRLLLAICSVVAAELVIDSTAEFVDDRPADEHAVFESVDHPHRALSGNKVEGTEADRRSHRAGEELGGVKEVCRRARAGPVARVYLIYVHAN